MIQQKFIVSLLFATSWLASGQAQSVAPAFIHYTTDDGLSHDEVRCIFKDSEGFMWFGTLGGLNRFDGRNFKIYQHQPNNPTSLPNNLVTGITEAPDKTLWVATEAGMCRFDKRTQSFEPIILPEQSDEILSNEGASKMVIDRAGNGWFGCYKHLVRMNLQTQEIRRFPNPDRLESLGDIFIDRKGRIWVGVQTALYRFNPENQSFKYYFGNVKGVRPGVDIGKIYEAEDGTIWCGSWGLGMFRYNESLDIFEDYPDDARVTPQVLLDQDAEGKKFFWSAGGNDGLYLFYPDEQKFYRMSPNPREPYSHNGFQVMDFYKDTETGIVWLATESGGVEKFDPLSSKFRRALLPIEKGFSQFSFVSSIIPDQLDPSGHRYWVSVWGTGLFEWNREENTFHFIPPRTDGSLNNEIFDLAQDAAGTLYLATANGITVYHPQTGKSEFFGGFMQYPFVFNKALSIMVDHAGQVWIGANYDGLFCFNPKTQQIKKVPFYDPMEVGKTTGYITAIKEDAQHQLWIATHVGVFRLNPETGVSQYFHNQELPNTYRSDGLFLGRNGVVWIATRKGLIKMDATGKVLQHLGVREGLKSEHVFNVIEDQQGIVWIATTNLLYRLDPATHKITPFDKKDGLFGNNLTEGFNMIKSGEIFIGFQNAFNYFNPDEIPTNQLPPKVCFTDVKILNQERIFDFRQMLVLQPHENIVSISFAALNFSQPERNQYAYKLEGFDPDWVYTDQPTATYTNLDGGNYTFRVRASNNDGIWNEKGASLALKIIPPFRKTWYFAVLIGLLIGSIITAILFYRQQQRHRLALVREHIARDLHDDMGSTLSSIRFFSEYARSKVTNPEVAPILQRISETAATLSESMQDIVWAINTKNDQLDDLITRMRQFGFKVLDARGIDFVVHISKNFQSKRLKINQRRNVYLIFKEAITNAAKYADCSEVKLYIGLTKNVLQMTISDNGKGFDPQMVEGGNGLDNMQKRAAEIGGELALLSQIENGTKVTLHVKLN